MAEIAVSKSSLHSWKPTPTGSDEALDEISLKLDGEFDDALEDVAELFSAAETSSRSATISDVLTVGPRKPIPPARDVARANAGPAMTRIGALTINGVVAQGYERSKFLAM